MEMLPACPIEAALQILNNSWKILIIRDLSTGTKRFGELKNSVTGISPKVLTGNLRSMEEVGVLQRKVFAEIPPRTEYTLTELGESLIPVINAFGKWGAEFQKNYRKYLNTGSED